MIAVLVVHGANDATLKAIALCGTLYNYWVMAKAHMVFGSPSQ
jgi:hypothetical protein